jgi:hypothetical protein
MEDMMGFPNVGIALGAGVNELNRQRQLDDSDQRLQLQKDAAAKTGQFQDAQLADMDQRRQDHAAATKIWQDSMPVFQGGWQAAADHLGDAYNSQNADYGYNDGQKATIEKTNNGAYVTQTNPDGTVAARTFYTPQQVMNEHLRTVYSKLAAINPEYGQQLGNWLESQGKEQARQQDAKQKSDYTAQRDAVKDDQFNRELDIKSKRNDIWASSLGGNKQARGLTPAQERANLEIDAARSAVSGLSPDEIKRKTTNYMLSGRENPDYDESIAHAVKLAGRRKVGADDTFDSHLPATGSSAPRSSAGSDDEQAGGSSGAPVDSSGAIDRAELAKRFRSDPSMNQHTLGKETPKGIEVLRGGKLIGYYR